MYIKVKRLNHATKFLPSYATKHSAGMDLLAANIENILIKPQAIELIPTGISIELPDSFEAQIRPRSGLAIKNGITVLNAPGTIDTDYRGEIKVILINHSNKEFIVERGMKIAQMIITKYEKILWEEVDFLNITSRNVGGFGSTGNY